MKENKKMKLKENKKMKLKENKKAINTPQTQKTFTEHILKHSRTTAKPTS